MTRIPSYRRHKPSKQAVVTLNGKDFYLGKFGTAESREAYNAIITAYLKIKGQEAPSDLLVPIRSRTNITVVEAVDQYLKRTDAQRSKAEHAHVRGMLRCFVELYENEPAANIRPSDLREVRRMMIAKDWSRTYVNDQVGRVKRMYKWLVIESLVPETVYRALSLLQGLRRGEEGVRETKRILTVEDTAVDATLPHLPDVVADMVRLQRITGMRPAELCMLRPCDVDRSNDVWLYRPESHKTQHHGHDRVIFLGPKAQEILLRYLARGRLIMSGVNTSNIRCRGQIKSDRRNDR